MDADHNQFSEREKEVIALLLQGKSNKQIALALHIAQSTVEYHLKNIYNKLQVSSRTEAVIRLGKSIGGDSPSESGQSTVEMDAKHSGNGGKRGSMSKIPTNRMVIIIGGLLIVILLTTILIPLNHPAQDSIATPVLGTPTAILTRQPTSMEWQDQIVYLLDPRKFDDGNPTTKGGDLAGIRKQITYLKKLGITAVLLSPVFSTRDFRTVDPGLGTNEELAQLIEEFHSTENGQRINVILDLRLAEIVVEHPWFNHSSYFRPWNRQDENENIGCSETYCEPYTMPDGTLVDHGFGGAGMPILNHTAGMDTETGVYRDVRDTVFWLVDRFEIDGVRYATAHYYNATFWPKFMSDFRARYDETKPNFWHLADVFILGKTSWQILSEEFVNQTSSVGPIQMESVYDYALTAHIQEVFAKGTDPNRIYAFVEYARLLPHLLSKEHFENPERLIATVDGLASFLHEVENGHPVEKFYLTSAFLFTINRVPLISSGNEYAIDYTEPGTLFTGGLDADFHEHYKKLIQIRRDNAALQKDSLIALETTANIISYARQHEGQTFIVVLNNHADPTSDFEINLRSQGISCGSVVNLLVENDPNIQLDEATLSVTLNAWEPKIIRCE